MYEKILVPVDNSPFSQHAVSAAVSLGEAFRSSVTCMHVYAAMLHERSFMKLEPALPQEYRDVAKLAEQREYHGALIEKGLRAISDSYLQKAEEKFHAAGVRCCVKSAEGKNFQAIVKEAQSGDHDLIILGAYGLGKVKSGLLGSVCQRVVRHTDKDALVIKGALELAGGELLVAVDGSVHSFAGLSKALELAHTFDMRVGALSVYDPQFHYRVFNSLVEVLSQEAKSIFPMEHQEKLHTAVIDQGLKRVALGYLEEAKKAGAQRGIPVDTWLLEGKPFDAILDFLKERRPSLLVTGRHGIHRSDLSDIGSNTENLLLLSDVNQLVVSQAPADFLQNI